MLSRRLTLAIVGALAACASPARSPTPTPAPAPAPAPASADRPPPAKTHSKPNIDPAPLDRPNVTLRADTTPLPPPKEPARIAPPAAAYARGWMALASTGVDAFRALHPAADGRGVLIGILDTGIDPAVPGLVTTSTGERKVLDLRDFSHEGEVALERIVPKGDTVVVAGRRLAGFGRIVALNSVGPYYGGAIREIPLGEGPAADLNGNGRVSDTLPVIVTRATDGWILFADTDGDGSLANEKPIHDYLAGHEIFGWTSRARPAPVSMAANFSDGAREPKLDLFFDNGDHGTFVSGVAAGHDIYGVAGFDGVAPGAQLIGLKIANNAQGGISTTGSMLQAMDYAIRFAERRHMPLVLNMSFGVGNEIEGEARIDHIVDSVLAAHPDLVFTVSAGNDGPGLSTIGFPGSATRVLTAGATLPGVFLPRAGAEPVPDQVAPFSARGGELAKPDVLTPGFAYSTVPRFNTGDEVKQGTSFSSPHLAGIAAIIRSALLQDKIQVDARAIKQAIMVTARPKDDLPFIDEGAGVPEVEAAYRWLKQKHSVPEVTVRTGRGHGATAAFRTRGLAPGDTLQTFELLRSGAAAATTFTLRSDAPWLTAPRTVTVGGAKTTVTLRYKASALRAPGSYSGVVSGWLADTMAGPAFRLVNTIVVPHPAGDAELMQSARLEPGATRRAFFVADSTRPFLVRVAAWSGAQGAFAFLHEPDGMPFRDGAQQQAGADSNAAVFRVDGRDAVAGVYEIDAVGEPTSGSTVSARVQQAPFRIAGVRDSAGIAATLTNLTAQAVSADVGAVLGGAQRVETVEGRGSDTVRIPFVAPAGARGAVVDVTMLRGQWERFTDFGLTVFDSAGRQIAKQPLNYALGRLQVPLAQGHRDAPVEVRLFPGLADPGSAESWKATVTIRLYADSTTALATTAGPKASLSIPAGESRTATFAMVPPPWLLGEGFSPLAVIVALSNGEVWTREVAR